MMTVGWCSYSWLVMANVATLEPRFESMMSKFCVQTDKRLERAEAAHVTALPEVKALLEQSPKVRRMPDNQTLP